MSTKQKDPVELAARLVRAHEVKVGRVKGWQVQRWDKRRERWVSQNVLCSEEEAMAERDRVRAALVEVARGAM